MSIDLGIAEAEAIRMMKWSGYVKDDGFIVQNLFYFFAG